jgi:hypothetical protein
MTMSSAMTQDDIVTWAKSVGIGGIEQVGSVLQNFLDTDRSGMTIVEQQKLLVTLLKGWWNDNEEYNQL